MDLNGTAVIVTGSSSGIGAACVRLLARRGANVVVNCSRSEQAAREVASECEARGVEALVCRADVSNDDDCRRMVAETMSRYGRLDGLINNAGTTKFVDHADLEGLAAEDFQTIYGVNVIGPFQMTRAVVPHMKAAGRGAICNVSSIAAVTGVGSSIAYAASKGALNTMTLSLARALGPEIRVNAICPGFVEGKWLREGMGAERYEATRSFLEKTTPLRKAGTPEDMAEAAVWFLEGAGHITGEVLIVDSGLHLGGAPTVAR